LSPASNPTQLNNFAQLRVCEFGYGAGGEEIELSYNVEAGKTTPDRHQCGSVGGGEETVREVCAGWEWRGFGNWSERMENDGSCVRMRWEGKFQKYLETNTKIGRKLGPAFKVGLSWRPNLETKSFLGL